MSTSIASELIRIRSFDAALGADVEGVDASSIDDATFSAIEKAWFDHVVLRLRGQHLSDLDLMRFSARFGALDRIPIRAVNVAETDDPRLNIAPEARDFVTVISNEKIEDRPAGGLGNYELVWHTDMSYNPEPPMASLLYAIEVPPEGGNTSFCNMYRAYETLPADLKCQVANLSCIHDASRNSAGELRRGFVEVTDPRRTVGARHPIVRTHPATHRRCLFLGRRRNAYIPDLPLEESEALLDALWRHATKPEFAWTQTWQKGDLLIWDNRAAVHRRDGFDDRFPRIMHRTQIRGDKPF